MARIPHRWQRLESAAGMVVLAACSAQPNIIDNSCPFTAVATVAPDDPGDLGFTAEQVVAVASVTSGGEATSNDIEGSWPVSLSHVFTREGEATLIDFGAQEDAECPSGRGLMVPVSYEISGTIGDWWVRDAHGGHALLATALALDAMSSTPAEYQTWQAEVDPRLRDIALSSVVPEPLQGDCELIFSLTPAPDNMYAGAWADELATGSLNAGCDQTYTGAFLHWTSTLVE